MTLHVIGAGVGRTGTQSLKLALNRLGLGPTHHMEDVIADPKRHVPLWTAAAEGRPDWSAIYNGYASAVDWPTASFWQELSELYPDAKVILTVRNPESWAESFSETINKLMTAADKAPPEMQPFLQMVKAVKAKAGFHGGTDEQELIKAFDAHVARVKAALPAHRLLVYEVKEGWQPLCLFLDLPVPDEPFPKVNTREDFWARMRNN